MVQLASTKGRHCHRIDRGGLQKRPEAHAPPRSHFRRDATEARSRQNAIPQNRQRKQGPRLHSQQGRQTGVHRRRR